MAKFFDASQVESVKLEGAAFDRKRTFAPSLSARRNARRLRRANRAL